MLPLSVIILHDTYQSNLGKYMHLTLNIPTVSVVLTLFRGIPCNDHPAPSGVLNHAVSCQSLKSLATQVNHTLPLIPTVEARITDQAVFWLWWME